MGRTLSRQQRALLFLGATSVFALPFARVTATQDTDFVSHIQYAESLRSPSDITSPHFLFQLLLIALTRTTGMSSWSAAVLIAAACYGVMAVLIGSALARAATIRPVGRQLALAICVLLASHIFLLTVFVPNFYYGYFVPVMYHNPTQQVAKAFALAMYLRYRHSFLDCPTPRLATAWRIGALGIGCAAAKPAFLLAFTPAAAVVELRRYMAGERGALRPFVTGVAAPVTLVLGFQSVAFFQAGGVELAPFAIFDPVETLWKFPASMAFPLLVTAAAWPFRERRVQLLVLLVGFGFFWTLFVAESGRFRSAGNFAWTGQTTVFIAYVECFLRVAGREIGARARRIAWTIFAVHVFAGLIWYVAVCLVPLRSIL